MRRAGTIEQRAGRRADRGPRARSWPIRYASVRPVSTMSSTTTTSRPLMSESRSWRIFTRPESGANREIDMKSTLDVDTGDRPGEVGDEDQRALQHADEHDPVGMVPLDLARRGAATCAATASASSRTVAGTSAHERTCGRPGAATRCAAGGRDPRARPASPCVRACASGLRCRRYGSSTCSKRLASRSANARYMRRCRASMPCRRKLDATRAIASASSSNSTRSRDVCAGITRPYSSSCASSSSVMPGRSRELGAGEDHLGLRPAVLVGAFVVAHRRRRRARLVGLGARAAPSRRAARRRAPWPCAAWVRACRRRSPPALRAADRGAVDARGVTVVELVEPFLDHLERQEVLALLAQDEAQPFDVGG